MAQLPQLKAMLASKERKNMKLLTYWTSGASLIAIILFIGACINKMPTDKPGTVIIVNGPSAVGKSSILKAFQAKQEKLWLSIGIDNFFVGVLPPNFFLEDNPKRPSVMTLVITKDFEGPTATAVFGTEGKKIMYGMHHAIAAYARAGNNVIVDYIKYEPEFLADLQAALHGIKVIWVGVTAKLETIQEREKKRATSPQGHARSVYHTVHQGIKYDLMLNTDTLTPEQSADKIIEFVKKESR